MDRLNAKADRVAQSGANLKKIVEAAKPLHATLDDAQKHKFITLGRMLVPERGRFAMEMRHLRMGEGDRRGAEQKPRGVRLGQAKTQPIPLRAAVESDGTCNAASRATKHATPPCTESEADPDMVRMTGMAFEWIGATTALASVVREVRKQLMGAGAAP